MKNVACRRVELNNFTAGTRRVLDATVSKYRDACAEILVAVSEHWSEISAAASPKDQLTIVERLIHTTKKNKAEYPLFDKRLYKFPCYYRRAAIHFVIGAYSSYMSNLKAYEERRHEAISNGKRFKDKAPKLQTMNTFPVLYRKESIQALEDGNYKIKVFIRNTWDWITVGVPNRDKKDIAECARKGKLLNPSLVFAYGKYHLDFPVQYEYTFKELPALKNRRILAIDMGINCDAVCSVMRGDGTIESRHFVNLASEKDSLDRLINRTRKLHRTSGIGQELLHIWTKIEGVKDNHAKQLASRIVKLAVAESVDVVVFENLDKLKPRGDKKERIHHWCKKTMQELVFGMLHRNGIRYSLVNPKNTSRLAFDGSGAVVRDRDNYSLCTFRTGKRYNCDLSASYNIGARYFIREFFKSLSASEELQYQAKVPDTVKRTNCTLDTYRKLLQAS